jgi:uncharacterized protein
MKRTMGRLAQEAKTLYDHKQLRFIAHWLADPRLWHINRRSTAGAFAVGLFMMYMPPFGQPLMAATAAVFFRVNLPISVVLVFITNPVTIPPMFYVAYLLGAWILGEPVPPFELDFWSHPHNWLTILTPLGLGSVLCASLCSLVGWLGVRLLWHLNVLRYLRRRRARRTPAGAEAHRALPRDGAPQAQAVPVPGAEDGARSSRPSV